jgi:hypothetical protein
VYFSYLIWGATTPDAAQEFKAVTQANKMAANNPSGWRELRFFI